MGECVRWGQRCTWEWVNVLQRQCVALGRENICRRAHVHGLLMFQQPSFTGGRECIARWSPGVLVDAALLPVRRGGCIISSCFQSNELPCMAMSRGCVFLAVCPGTSCFVVRQRLACSSRSGQAPKSFSILLQIRDKAWAYAFAVLMKQSW